MLHDGKNQYILSCSSNPQQLVICDMILNDEGIHKEASVKNVWDLRMYNYRVFLFLMVLVLGTV